MTKIRMEIKLSNGEDKHVLKFDEGDLQILIDALHDYRCDDCEKEYLSDEMSGALNYFYSCLTADDDEYITLYGDADTDALTEYYGGGSDE